MICSPASHHPFWTYIQNCPVPDAESRTCFTLCSWWLPSPPICQALSTRPHYPWRSLQVPLIEYHLQMHLVFKSWIPIRIGKKKKKSIEDSRTSNVAPWNLTSNCPEATWQVSYNCLFKDRNCIYLMPRERDRNQRLNFHLVLFRILQHPTMGLKLNRQSNPINRTQFATGELNWAVRQILARANP